MEQLKIDNEVINHLIFHKSLIDEKEDNARINHYVDMLQKTDEGDHLSIDDPFDRSISIAFELVLKQQLNPWEIDLVNFSTMYLKRAKDAKIDLLTAGRIIYMAWKVLKLQSNNLVIDIESKIDDTESFGWSDIPTEQWINDDDYSYTNLLLKMPEPPINEPIRRDSKRKVTLMELLDAFDNARKESEEYQMIDLQRKREKQRLKDIARKRMKGTTHEDHLEKDVEEVWNKIKNITQKTILFNDLLENMDRDEVIRIFMSILFLSNDNKINIFQKQFPYGKIYIKNVGFN